MKSIEILERLISFPTVSQSSNLELVSYLREILENHGAECFVVRSSDAQKANLFATIGPRDRPGIILSGHTDVVSVEGQNWTSSPFRMTEHDGRLYGRGTADMKGFVACAVSVMIAASTLELKAPLHLALSYDEEIGCVGVRDLLASLRQREHKSLLCIIGEPTLMSVVTGHKGKTALKTRCVGREGHSALAPMALNALHLGCDFVSFLRTEQRRLEQEGPRDEDYEVPYTTVHVGMMKGGIMLNIVPKSCEIDFEIRNVSADDPQDIVTRLRNKAERVVFEARRVAPEADIAMEIVNSYPGLDTPAMSPAVAFVKDLVKNDRQSKVAYGTEGGLFQRELGIPTVICGPGAMAQGHRSDEYVSLEQLEQCDLMLSRLLGRLTRDMPFL